MAQKRDNIALNLDDLDIDFCRQNNPALKGKTDEQIIKHYIRCSRNNICAKPDELDIDFYRQNNTDLLDKYKTDDYLIKHYVLYGKKEGRMPYNMNINTDSEESIELNQKDDMFDMMDEHELLGTCLFKYKNKNFLKYELSINDFKNIKKFILIVDFHNGGGGATKFINTIVSKYKKHQTFVIVRNIDNKLVINVNEEYSIDVKHTQNDNFFDDYKDNIIKIFINHTLKHTTNFLEKIFSLDKHVTTITHDYYTITNNPQPLYCEIEKLCIENHSPVDINKYDLLITQNEVNLNIFKKYYSKPIHIVNLPDYKKRSKCVSTHNNNVIVVGIIGYINKLKGEEILKNIMNNYKHTTINNKKLKFVVIGQAFFDNQLYNNCYDSLIEFNNILISQRINILLELSIWPETYSYTLTLAMLTDLPILVYNKEFNSVINSRLKNYKKALYFNDISQLENMFSNGQQYLYTLKPII